MPENAEKQHDPDATIPMAAPVPTAGAKESPDLPLPEELTLLLPHGNYSVDGFLGQGGMGAVYKGTQVRLQRKVAIKIMRRDQGKDHGFEERFRREALALAQLNHPNIVNVIDYGEAGPDYLYIVMEFVDGTDLVGVIRSGQMTQETALKLLPQICDALQFAHDNGIVHRDIKPANILLTRDGRIKMADFGLAKRFDVNSTFQTQAGAGMGTPDYAAPEQFDPNGNVDHRADIYALGVMIYQMVTGQLPRGAWKPPSEKADVDAHWDKIVSHALQTDPSDRYASVSEIKTDISSILLPISGQGGVVGNEVSRKSGFSGKLGGSTTALTQAGGRSVTVVQAPVPPRSKKPLLFGLAGALMIAAGGYFAWDKFAAEVRPISVTNPVASAAPALPAPIRLWDAADKLRKQPGVSWEDDALRLDNVEVARVFPLVQRVAVKTSIRVTPDTEAVKLCLKQRSRDEGTYFLYVDFANANLALLIAGQDKQRHLKSWNMPRQYRPGEWLPVELRVVDGEISVSLEGKLLGTVRDSALSDFTALTLSGKPYAHFRDIEVAPLDPSWTNWPPAPSIPVTVTIAETVQRPVPKPAAWVDATAQVRDAVVQAGAGAVQGDWLALSKPNYLTRMLDRKILRNAVVRMSFKGVAGMALRTSPTDFSYQCVLNSDRTLGLFSFDGLALTRVHFNKRVKLEPDFDLLAEHELVMAVEEDLISVWLDGRLMLSQRDSHIAQGQITVIFQAAGSDDSLHPHVKKVEYADLGGTPAVPASQSAVSRTWQAPTPTVAADTEWTNLIPHIKPERDVIRGDWTVDEKGLTAKRAEWAFCNIPVQDPGTDYDLRYKVTRGEGTPLAMFFAFRKGNTGAYTAVDYSGGGELFADRLRWVSVEDRTDLDRNAPSYPKAKRQEWLPRDKLCTVLLQVREKEVIVSINDEEVLRWPTNWANTQQHGRWAFPMFQGINGLPIFGVGIYDCEAVFHSIEMRRVGEAVAPTAPIGEPGSIPHLLTSPDYEWSAPVNLGPLVNSPALEVGTWVSPDGLGLIFGSKREGDGELFESRRINVDAPWSKPALVFSSVEPGIQEHPWLSEDGLSLYYHSTTGPGHQTGAVPTGDIFLRERAAAGQPWSPPVNLGPNVNQPGWDSAPRLSKDELSLLFTTVRAGGQGIWDIWRCRRKSRQDSFGPPENLGPGLNTFEAENHAMIAADNRTILFLRGIPNLTSSRLLMATPDAKGQYQATALDFPVIGKLSNPWLSADGRTLWFAWNGPGSVGDMDLWEIRRVPKAKKNPSAPSKTSASSAAATKDTPFENTLGMKFVPVPITGGPADGKRVLFSVWETRVQDYEAFVKETKCEWRPVQFRQGTDHPAMNVSWEDAQAFCLWLTKREQKNAQLGPQDRYRLPTDHEWSCAVGIGAREDARALPQAKDQLIGDAFPWGREWPPAGRENYAGEELLGLKLTEVYPFITPISGHKDGFMETAPVGSFQANANGLYDLGGNAWEWCEDWFDKTQEARVLRGAAWAHFDRLNLLSSKRSRGRIGMTLPPFIGFRCVLESYPE